MTDISSPSTAAVVAVMNGSALGKNILYHIKSQTGINWSPGQDDRLL